MRVPSLRKSLKSLPPGKAKPLAVVLMLASIGTFLTLGLRAASPTSHFEAENAVRQGNAAAVSDASASNAQALKFNMPTTATNCALPNFPDETCTGIPDGTSLTVHNGELEITANNTIVDSKDVRGCIFTNNRTGVVIRNTKAKCIHNTDVGNTDFRVLIEDSLIDCGSTGGSTGVSEANITLRRVEITGCENGLDINQSITIEDSYIHELYENQAIDTHTDGIQMASGHFVLGNPNPVDGALNVIVRHNTIFDYNRVSRLHGTSAIITNTRNADTNVLIQDNLLAGGAYTLYCRYDAPANNLRIINNRFSTQFSPSVGAFGAMVECHDEAQVTGNVYHESGQPVPF